MLFETPIVSPYIGLFNLTATANVVLPLAANSEVGVTEKDPTPPTI